MRKTELLPTRDCEASYGSAINDIFSMCIDGKNKSDLNFSTKLIKSLIFENNCVTLSLNL